VRVLVLTHTAQLGGAELALLRLCEALPRHVTVRVVSFEDGDLVERLRALGVEVEVLPARGAWNRQARSATASLGGALSLALGGAAHAARVGRRVRELAPDVVQSWTLKSHVVSALGRPFHRAPLVWFVHDRLTEEYLGRVNRSVLRLLLRVPAVLVANSRATARTTGRSCLVAYPGLTRGQFRPPAEVEERGLRLPLELLVLGRVSRTKGQAVVIEAMADVCARYPGARLRIVGAPLFGSEDYDEHCRVLADDLELGHAVEFVGPVEDPTVELDRATALVHASELPEPFGQVVTEAVARGVPVIATDGGGIPEILLGEDGARLGRLVPPSDASAIARAVVDLVEDAGTTLRMAQEAYERASRVFTIEGTVQVMLEAWQRAAGGSPASASG
jgi:glycosyltransferase involved in cell wall biosynthesis